MNGKLIFLIGQDSFFLHFGQFIRQGAPVHSKIVSQLLPVERDRKLMAAVLENLL